MGKILYPNDPEVYKAEEEFLFGENLLVAPVVEKGAKFKKMYLPEGNWINFNDENTTYQGGQWIELPVTLSSIPVFVKKGTIIPMMPVMQYIHEKENAPLILKIFPSERGEAEFILYEDDGVTNDYKSDIFSKITFTAKNEKNGYVVNIGDRIENGYKPYGARNIVLDVGSSSKPKEVTVDNQKIRSKKINVASDGYHEQIEVNSWFWDKEMGKILISIPDTGKASQVKIYY